MPSSKRRRLDALNTARNVWSLSVGPSANASATAVETTRDTVLVVDDEDHSSGHTKVSSMIAGFLPFPRNVRQLTNPTRPGLCFRCSISIHGPRNSRSCSAYRPPPLPQASFSGKQPLLLSLRRTYVCLKLVRRQSCSATSAPLLELTSRLCGRWPRASVDNSSGGRQLCLGERVRPLRCCAAKRRHDESLCCKRD